MEIRQTELAWNQLAGKSARCYFTQVNKIVWSLLSMGRHPMIPSGSFHSFWLHPWSFLMCLTNALLNLKDLPQLSQWKGISPVCILSCLLTSLPLWNCLPQNLQACGSPEWPMPAGKLSLVTTDVPVMPEVCSLAQWSMFIAAFGKRRVLSGLLSVSALPNLKLPWASAFTNVELLSVSAFSKPEEEWVSAVSFLWKSNSFRSYCSWLNCVYSEGEVAVSSNILISCLKSW